MTAYGSWPSPLDAARLSAGGVGVGGSSARLDADGGLEIWWSESRPSEGGRIVLCRRRADGTVLDALPAPWSARTRVHEYGGGASFHGPDHVYFSSWDDQRLHRLEADRAGDGAEPEPITPAPEEHHAWRFADGRVSPDGAWIVAVAEDHHAEVVADRGEALNSLVAIPADGGEPSVLTSHTDFVAAPRFSPDGRWLSWFAWDHPSMPWDSTRLCAAPVWSSGTELRLGNVKVVAGTAAGPGGGGIAAHGADWLADGRLVFSDDRTGWWNLRAWRPGDDDTEALTALEGSEIGAPAWVFGTQQWTETTDGRLLAVVTDDAVDSLVEVVEGAVRPIDVEADGITSVAPAGDGIVVTTTHATRPASVQLLDLAGGATTIRSSDDLGIDPVWFGRGEPLWFDSEGRPTHAFLHLPSGPPELVAAAAADGSLPPLIVVGHGGPTAHADPALDLKIQYWTSRGFAVADVNYGGSTGFGRAYRERLLGTWGALDVIDCANAARHLVAAGRVDPERCAIRGSSAGGLTVLGALIHTDVFAAGTSLYGVADLEALASDTHKFEARYLDGLVGPYPEATAVYVERSPIHHTDGLSCPLLVLQGSDDEIVPLNQAEAIVAAVAAKGIPHAYLLFEGEQHGFRQAENIARSLEAELWFYGRVFGFDPADAVEPVPGAVGL